MAQDIDTREQRNFIRIQGRQQLIVLAVLITIYAALPVVLVIDFILQLTLDPASTVRPVIDTNALTGFINPLASAQGSVLETLHKLILPLAALFLGANFNMLRNGRVAVWLFVVPLVGTIAALLCASLLDAFQSTEIKVRFPGLTTLFRDIASNLGIVMMLLIGQSFGRQG